jgi:hypothetical protein
MILKYTFDPANRVRLLQLPGKFIDNDFPRVEFYSMIGYHENNINRGGTIIYLMFSHENTLHVLSYNIEVISKYKDMDKVLIDTIDMLSDIDSIVDIDNNLFFSFIFSQSECHSIVMKFLTELIYNPEIRQYYKLKYI